MQLYLQVTSTSTLEPVFITIGTSHTVELTKYLVRSSGRVIRTNGNRSDWKKAIITLSGDDKIDLINGDFS